MVMVGGPENLITFLLRVENADFPAIFNKITGKNKKKYYQKLNYTNIFFFNKFDKI